jgi:hypothetical protein
MRKNISSTISIFVLICALLALAGAVSAKREAGAHQASAQKHLPKIVPSSLLSLVAREMREHPGMSPKELAAYANAILPHIGFNYEFDLCEIVGKANLDGSTLGNSQRKTYLLPMTQSSGGAITFRIDDENLEGLCGECFFRIACLNVTRRDLLMISKGRRYRLKRSKQMALDEMSLVDETMKRALRTWQVPYQSVPLGISQDATKLYLELRDEGERDVFEKLALEISETGLRIQARDEVNLKEGEGIEQHPIDPKNAYLSFMRFRIGDQSYIIRFSGPCT